MPIVPMKCLLDDAWAKGYAVPAFNVNFQEQIWAVMNAARTARSPVIVQMSRGALKYAEPKVIWHLMLAASELYPEVLFAPHLDHGNSPQTCMMAMDLGLTSVMMDGTLLEDGKTPSGKDMEYNIRVTREVVAKAHPRGVTVEAEVGCLGHLGTGQGGKEDGHGAERKLTREEMLTDPDDAERFVRATGCDALAVAIGTSHGAYKFTEPPTEQVLVIERVREIHARIPGIPLVMHGASSVPQELLDELRTYGGQMKPTWGVPIDEIRQAIRLGVCKVNVDTDNRLAITAAIRRVFATEPEKFDPRDYLRPAREAMMEVCLQRISAFGAENRAPGIQVVSLEELARRYSA